MFQHFSLKTLADNVFIQMLAQTEKNTTMLIETNTKL